MRSFTVPMNPDRDVTLEASLFDQPEPGFASPVAYPRPAMIVLPGGGYEFLSQREADPPAVAFQRHGFNAFVLRYSIREHARGCNPAVDAARAVRWVRGHAAELGVDPTRVAVLGFSAGGHVAAQLATHWHTDTLTLAERAEYEDLSARGVEANEGLLEHESRPDALVASYAVLSDDWRSDDYEPAPLELADCISAASPATPPSFVWTTDEDTTVPPSQSLRFVAALAEQGVGFEYHHFAHGPHGLSTGDRFANADRESLPENAHAWVDLCARWLEATWAAR